jgi:NitT/TauT family transport system permease protein
VLLLGGWEVLARTKLIDEFFFSKPSDIMERLYTWSMEGTSEGPLWYHLWVTMEESLLGFFSGSIAGILAGIVLGRNRLLSDIFSIYIKVINSVPRVVLAPIFIMLFGLGLTSKVALAFVMVFFVVFSNAFQGVREADRNLMANAQILGAKGWQLTRTVVIPSAMSWIFASLHVSFGFAIVGAIVGEFVGSRHGIGLLINIAKGSFDAAGMYAAIVIIMVVALAAEYAMTMIENRLATWRPAPANDDAH